MILGWNGTRLHRVVNRGGQRQVGRVAQSPASTRESLIIRDGTLSSKCYLTSAHQGSYAQRERIRLQNPNDMICLLEKFHQNSKESRLVSR